MLDLGVRTLERLTLDQLFKSFYESSVHNRIIERVRPGMFQGYQSAQLSMMCTPVGRGTMYLMLLARCDSSVSKLRSISALMRS